MSFDIHAAVLSERHDHVEPHHVEPTPGDFAEHGAGVCVALGPKQYLTDLIEAMTEREAWNAARAIYAPSPNEIPAAQTYEVFRKAQTVVVQNEIAEQANELIEQREYEIGLCDED